MYIHAVNNKMNAAYATRLRHPCRSKQRGRKGCGNLCLSLSLSLSLSLPPSLPLSRNPIAGQNYRPDILMLLSVERYKLLSTI